MWKNCWRRDRLPTPVLGFPCGSAGEESACNAEDLGSVPELGRSPGEGISYPLQYSGLENSTDCTVHGVAKSQTRLSGFHFTWVADELTVCVCVYFWTLVFHSLYFSYAYSMILITKSWNKLVYVLQNHPLFRIGFTVLDLLFPWEFYHQHINLFKKKKILLKFQQGLHLYVKLGRINIYIILSLPVCKHGLYSFQSSFIYLSNILHFLV